MPITIIPRGQSMRKSGLTAVIIGHPSTGKTTLSNTGPDPLLLAFDLKGARRSLNRPDTVGIQSWEDIEHLEIGDIAAKYKSITIDTIGRCLEVLAEDIMRREPKMSNGGQLSMQGFGRLKSRFRKWLAKVDGFGVNVVMIAHATEERHGDDVRLRIDAQGSSKELVYQEADLMGRVVIRDGKRYLDWNPSDAGFGKNPAGLPAGYIPNVQQDPQYLSRCIRTTLDFLNRANEESILEEERLRELRTHLEGVITNADAATKLARNMLEANAPNADKAMLARIAKERGYELQKVGTDDGQVIVTFTDPNAPEPEAKPAPEPVQEDAF